MSNARTNERVAGLSLSMATLGRNGPPAWEPNWIDYRSSVANVERREDRGDTAETCRECGCEIDITPEPHSPKCPTLVQVSVEHGRDLLDRMDAGEPLTDEPELEETAAVGKRADSGAAPLLVGEPERAAVSLSPNGGRVGRAARGQAQLSVLNEIVAGRHTAALVADAIGRPPKTVSVVLIKLQKKGLVEKVAYGCYSATDAGREAAAVGAPLDAKSSGRAARSAPAARKGNTAARPAESEREPEATDPAEAEVAPSRRALLAAEGAASRSDVLLRAVALAARAFADAILEDAA